MVTHVRLFKCFLILKTEKFPFMLIKISCDLSVFFFFFLVVVVIWTSKNIGRILPVFLFYGDTFVIHTATCLF